MLDVLGDPLPSALAQKLYKFGECASSFEQDLGGSWSDYSNLCKGKKMLADLTKVSHVH